MRVRVTRMTTPKSELGKLVAGMDPKVVASFAGIDPATVGGFDAFTQEDVVYDNDCVQECGKDEPLAYVNREDLEEVIHESCLFALKVRERETFIRIKDVPSGKLTAAEKVDALIGDSMDADDDEEYQLEEPVTFSVSISAGSSGMTDEEYYTEEVQVPKGQKIINIEFGKE